MENRTSATKGFNSIVQGKSVLAVRVFNVLAENFHIKDKVENKKLSYTNKKRVDKEFEFSEALRTDDLKAIVEHINHCNRHSYRLKFGREPSNDYIEMKVNEHYLEEPSRIRCPECKHVIYYYDNGLLEARLKCPNCGKQGIVRSK